MPQLRIAEHERLGACVVARRSALDEIAREGERRTREPDEWRRTELGHEKAYRLGDVLHVAGLQRRQAVEVGAGADRLRDDRSNAGDDVQVDADGLERQHDVAEQNGGVDPVPTYRLHRDLGDEVGTHARLEHPDALTQLAVLRERPARLAHEPDRRMRDGLASAGTKERGVPQGAVVAGHDGKTPMARTNGSCRRALSS